MQEITRNLKNGVVYLLTGVLCYAIIYLTSGIVNAVIPVAESANTLARMILRFETFSTGLLIVACLILGYYQARLLFAGLIRRNWQYSHTYFPGKADPFQHPISVLVNGDLTKAYGELRWYPTNQSSYKISFIVERGYKILFKVSEIISYSTGLQPDQSDYLSQIILQTLRKK